MTEGGEAPPVFHGEQHPMATHFLNEVNEIRNLLANTKLSILEILQNISTLFLLKQHKIFKRIFYFKIRILKKEKLKRKEKKNEIFFIFFNYMLIFFCSFFGY